MTRFLRQINDLTTRFKAAHVAELRTPIHVSGGIVGEDDRLEFIDRFVIHGGLPLTLAYDCDDEPLDQYVDAVA